ncbi:MAG: hypothetical protein LC687_00550 [Actinobacteria bacterium]|nr:hypothetical protein [Actinomycetota bacterium]
MTKRRCNAPDHIGPRYLPVEEFHKQGKRGGKQQYNPRCKACKNRQYRELYAENKREQAWPDDKKRAYSRARSRALTKLARSVPELYATILQEELDREKSFDFSGRGLVNRKLY